MSDERRTRAVRARIEGRVQGVSFRAWTRAEALRRGLTGWVRNRADGSVEAVLEGEAGAVEAMLAALRSGPSAARVARVESAPAEPGGAADFTIRDSL